MHYTREWLKRNPENFPVASRLLPEALRPRVMALYSFARGADEIADDTTASSANRRERLMALDKGLSTLDEGELPNFALAYARYAGMDRALISWGRDLVSAFIQDTIKSRYRDYSELLDYCQRSAVPIGRAFTLLCGEQVKAEAMDSLCIAMQLINHVRDCADDYVNRGQVYLPLDWFALAGIDVSLLAGKSSGRKLREILNRCLDICDKLLAQATPLTHSFEDLGVRREVTLIYFMARALCRKLRTQDPLRGKVSLSYFEIGKCLFDTWLTA